jgi:hypothetical protein
MSSKAGSLESHQVCSEHPTQKRLSYGETAENFRRWKRNVHEESDWRIRKSLAKHIGKKHQVIVIHPNFCLD